MLSYLKIENIAIIEKAEIEYSKGFNVLSGETGAGKSIVLDSLSAVLGFRTSRELIRTGEAEANVTAQFYGISDTAKDKLRVYGITPEEDGSLLLSRTIGQERNLCRVNDTVVTVTALRDIGSALISIHGQQDSRELLDSTRHLSYIDRIADDSPLLSQMEELYGAYSSTEKEIESLTMGDAEKARLRDILSFEINELTMAHLSVGEQEELKKRRTVIQNAEKLERLVGEAREALSSEEGEGACELLSGAADCLTKAAVYDEAFEAVSQTVSDAMYSVQNAYQELRDLCGDFSGDGDELDRIEERLDLLYKLSRKYGETEEEMLLYLDKAKEKLDSIDFSEEKLSKLCVQRDKQLKACKDKAAELSKVRKEAAVGFEKAVAKELSFLDMPHVKFKTQFKESSLSAIGADDAEFLISANVGEELKPVAKIASGGELSRIMLSFKNVLSDKDGIDTLVFDEIDAGVSGRAALKVGQKLREVADSRQVICVTHLAQIAAFADTHFLTEKKTIGSKTYTAVTPLDTDGRKRELARIMGGGNITEIQLKNAEEMLDYGRSLR